MSKAPFMPDREELAWAGGFFSGEGSTYWHSYANHGNGREYGTPSMEVTQTRSSETLVRFNKACGELLKLYGPYNNRAHTKADYYQLSVRGFEPVQAIVAMLWPWLSTAKREQALRILSKAHAYAASPKMERRPKRKETQRNA